MAYDREELCLGILELFAEAQQRHLDRLGPRRLAARQGLQSIVRSLKPAEIRKPSTFGCPFCGSHAPNHVCAEFHPMATFVVVYAGPAEWREPRSPSPSRSERAWRPPEYPAHDSLYRCPACGSGSNVHRCPLGSMEDRSSIEPSGTLPP